MSAMGHSLRVKNLTNPWCRLQTRTQYVQLRETDLEKKRQYCKSEAEMVIYPPAPADPFYPDQQVMQAFQSAMQLLNQS